MVHIHFQDRVCYILYMHSIYEVANQKRLIGEGLLYYKRCGFCTMLVWMLTVLTLYLYREGYE